MGICGTEHSVRQVNYFDKHAIRYRESIDTVPLHGTAVGRHSGWYFASHTEDDETSFGLLV